MKKELTPAEQKAAEQAAAQAAKAEAAAKRKAEAEAKKAEAEKIKADRKAEADAKRAEAQAAKDAKAKEAEDKKAAKLKEAEDKKAAKEANRAPEQNGVRRPGAAGLCGQVWTLADELSAKLKQPVPVADLLTHGIAKGFNPANVRTEYARWKKFHGLSGRIASPASEEPKA